ncbi:hypothetical protein IWW36_004455 [Coemansia brasiliensis]|uniref:Uncharacterized protein n=1 Tax=Coemansia brasiliensis TaxID=2650707 RepID=A0A9W8I3B2_9FUNG|nr:hypothetical protein IWW36_004455 [Coemansia brasiliensis]
MASNNTSYDLNLVNALFDGAANGEYVRDQISGTYAAYHTSESTESPKPSAYGSDIIAQLKQREVHAIATAESGKIEDAIKELSDIIAEYPEYASAYNNRAQAYRLTNASSSTIIADLDTAIKCASDNQTLGQAYTQKAIVLKAEGDQDGAFHNFSQGAKYGNEVAKMAAPKENPYAKLCGQMVAQAMQQLRSPN